MFASRRAATRSCSMPRESAYMRPAGRPWRWLSTEVIEYRQGSVKKAGQSSRRSSSRARAYSAFSRVRRADGSAVTSLIHVAAIGFPEAAHGGFGSPSLGRLRAVAAHVDYRDLVRGGRRSSAHEAAHAAVFHGDVARGAHEVQLAQPPRAHLRRIVGEAEIRPVQLHALRALGQHLAHGETVLDLLEHEAGEYGEDLELDAVAELVHAVEQARIGQPIAYALRADALLSVRTARAVVGAVDRVARVVGAVRADQDAAALGEARDPEGAEKRVEQARVVRVLHVLHVELPVVREDLDEAPEHTDRPAQHARDASEDLRAQIVLDGRRLRTETREDQAMERGRPKLARAVGGLGERWRHAPSSVRALLEGDAGEVALQIVRPRVVHALEVLGRPSVVEGDEGAAMRAAILEGADGAVGRAHHDHGHLADEGGAEVTGLREIRLEADEAPRRPLEDAAELRAVVRLVLVEPVGNARQAIIRPGPRQLPVAHRRAEIVTT